MSINQHVVLVDDVEFDKIYRTGRGYLTVKPDISAAKFDTILIRAPRYNRSLLMMVLSVGREGKDQRIKMQWLKD